MKPLCIAVAVALALAGLEAQAGEARNSQMIQGSSYQGTQYQGSTLQGSTMQGSTIQGVNLQGREQQGSTLQGSTMQGSTIQGVNMQGREQQGSRYQGTGVKDPPSIPVTMGSANLIDVQFPPVIGNWIIAGSAIALAWSTLPAAQPSVVRTEVSGTAFQITLSNGSIRQGLDLAGAVLTFAIDGELVRVRIASVVPDPKNSSVLLHDFRIEGAGTPLCSPDPEGRQAGFPLVGRTAPDGRFLDAPPEVFELTCTSGAQGKCVRFGYHPWQRAEEGVSMRRYHDACVRMMRADYCGDGRSWTKDGTLIDLWDDRGLQQSETATDPVFSFEAGWTPDGAACVARTRIPDRLTLDDLRDICPRFRIAPPCNEVVARLKGALVFNRSR